jgi:hypothetical protein
MPNARGDRRPMARLGTEETQKGTAHARCHDFIRGLRVLL